MNEVYLSKLRKMLPLRYKQDCVCARASRLLAGVFFRKFPSGGGGGGGGGGVKQGEGKTKVCIRSKLT